MIIRLSLFLTLALMASACRNASSEGAGVDGESVVSSSPLSLNVKDWIITSGFIVDLNVESAGKRLQWLAQQSTMFEVKPSNPSEVPGANGFYIDFNYQGNVSRIPVDEGAAEPHPNGRVMYCSRGRLFYAPVDTASPRLLQEMGVSSSELAGIQFYRVPTQTVDAWATYFDGKGIVAVYDGLGAAMRAGGIDEKSIVGIALGHEVGHIVDMKKAGFSNLHAARQRVVATCESRLKGLDSKSITLAVRSDTCSRDMASNSRGYEYSADNFAVSNLARKKYPQTFDPFAFVEFARKIGSGKYNAYGSHPDGVERGLQWERSLERVGIKSKIF